MESPTKVFMKPMLMLLVVIAATLLTCGALLLQTNEGAVAQIAGALAITLSIALGVPAWRFLRALRRDAEFAGYCERGGEIGVMVGEAEKDLLAAMRLCAGGDYAVAAGMFGAAHRRLRRVETLCQRLDSDIPF